MKFLVITAGESILIQTFITTQFLPFLFALYMASSALLIKVFLVSPFLNSATPQLTVI